jgi:hypothetical protein
LLHEDYYPCEAGDALSLLTIRGMMILCGTWGEEYEKSLREIPGFEEKRRQILAGIG